VQSLYELLGALPDDDADGLRAAFRKAVKASHPDNHPDDPDAPQRFRRIVRANTILSDERQRATYDVLLAEAHHERALDPEPRTFSEPRYRLPGVIGSMVIASVSIGAFLLLEYVLANSVVPAQMQDLRAQAPVLTFPAPAPSSDTVGLVGEHKRDRTPVSNEPDAGDAVREAVAPVALATADASVIPAVPEPAVKDARYYRERGSLAYRSGDLALALIDFDLAINLEPDVPDTYIDRAIVFRRMGNLTRALADIAKAKRIDDNARAVVPE
jgi:tetratricopeptide (TPR) repeat protein